MDFFFFTQLILKKARGVKKKEEAKVNVVIE